MALSEGSSTIGRERDASDADRVIAKHRIADHHETSWPTVSSGTM
jgi:hypothetical protein